jgi:predicted ATPase/DNA-binding SARP family transcriptional activator/uncharacterized protein HemY
MLWVDCDPALGRNSLSQSLSSLRRQLEPPRVSSGKILQADRNFVQLNPKTFNTDVREFEKTCRDFHQADREANRANSFANLINTYRGEFLPGFYEDWNLRERDRLQNLFVRTLTTRIEQLTRQDDLSTAIEYARRVIETDPLDEKMHLRLMNLYIATDNHPQALRQYEELVQILKKELDLPPAEEATTLAASLRARNIPETSPVEAVKKTFPTPPTDSPRENSFQSGVISLLAVEMAGTNDKKPVIKLIERHHGKPLKESMYLIATVFENPTTAFDCAIEIQRQFDSAENSEKKPFPKMALHLGELNHSRSAERKKKTEDLLELTLILLDSAHPGQLLCSQTFAVLLLNNLEPNVGLQELGNYRLTDNERPMRIYQADYKSRPRTIFPPLSARPANKNTLPLQLSRFFGREKETSILRKWLQPDEKEIRLITLTGPGGTGKTRLSLEVVGAIQEEYRNAVWFVPLAPIREPGYIPGAILDALRLETSGSETSLDHVVSILERDPSLLILDNFEQLLSHSPVINPRTESTRLVQTLLERVPNLKCLVTSRKKLGLFGEREFFLPPLPIPAEYESIEGINLCESVQLFVDRAQTVRPSFQLTNQNAAVIAELCRHLEGIPLALELAAAQSHILSPKQILKSLSRRLDFLTDRRHQEEERHQQLRATIDWSFQMLPPDVQIFFAGLAIFRDGGNLADVETVFEELLALDHLALLQDFSFLRIEENELTDEMRFHLLETLREYGDEKLSETDRNRLRERHTRTFAELAERATPHLKGSQQTLWLQRLEQDHQNLMMAIDWCLETGEIETGLQMAGALKRFWEIRGHVGLGREKLNELLAAAKDKSVSAEALARALSTAGDLALTDWDFPPANDFYGRSLKLYRRQKDLDGQALAINGLGRTAFEQGDYKKAYELDKECLRLRRELDDDHGVAAVLNNLGLIASEQGDYEIAKNHYQESLEIRQRLGDRNGIATILNNLGIINRRRGNYRDAKAAFEKSLAIRRELGDRRNVSASLSNLSWVAENECDYENARLYQEESYAIRKELEDDWGIALSFNILGILARHQGHHEKARNYFEEALAIRRRLGNKLGISETLQRLGDLLTAEGSLKKGQKLLNESLEIMIDTKNRLGLSEVLEAYSRLAFRKEDFKNSARLLFAARTLRENIGASPTFSDQKIISRQILDLDGVLSGEDFQQAEQDGSRMSLEEAAALAKNV